MSPVIRTLFYFREKYRSYNEEYIRKSDVGTELTVEVGDDEKGVAFRYDSGYGTDRRSYYDNNEKGVASHTYSLYFRVIFTHFYADKTLFKRR